MKINNDSLQPYFDDLAKARHFSEIYDNVLAMSEAMGFSYFAITEHLNTRPNRPTPMSIINYPKNWDGLFRKKRLFGVDPVHRASDRRLRGFFWSEVPRLIPMTKQDYRVFELAQNNGLGEGYTIPAHVPGQFNGSCSFGMRTGEEIRIKFDQIPILNFLGTAIFETAHSLYHGGGADQLERPRLTDRQLDCVALFAQGLSTRQISRALNITYETAVQHIKDAALRYGVSKRTPLAVRVLRDGSLSFQDVMPRISPHSWG
ncbi:autoinducer binding domain-containing protein [Sphingobium sp.]|uniref:helix-turn-helix transcriptional regulator n=1 Tax=Sphingobium sp. TaxID=1912891 RepID=UPI000DB514CC|nr:autoinducer binding domain-containing protein [Sphingobium sp.]PZU68669.1 MAG: LuxR family transcriptional regulator [Sphingobium sp.]